METNKNNAIIAPARAFREEITLTLPYPISANRYWRHATRGRKPVVYVSAEAMDYRKEVFIAARNAGIYSPISGRVSVSYSLFPALPKNWERRAKVDPENWDDDVMCIDLDNAQKVLFDSLKNVVFMDDAWIRKIEAVREVPDGKARIVVTIKSI